MNTEQLTAELMQLKLYVQSQQETINTLKRRVYILEQSQPVGFTPARTSIVFGDDDDIPF